MTGDRSPVLRRDELFSAMIREDDDEKRAELRRQYIERLYADVEAARGEYRNRRRAGLWQETKDGNPFPLMIAILACPLVFGIALILMAVLL